MNSIFYPKTIDDIEKVIAFNKKIYQGAKLEEFLKWEEWFNRIKNQIIINLKKEEFLKISFKSDNKFSLEVWKIGKEYNYICYNIATNYYNEFNDESTLIKK